jgi:hypothetical protein
LFCVENEKGQVCGDTDPEKDECIDEPPDENLRKSDIEYDESKQEDNTLYLYYVSRGLPENILLDKVVWHNVMHFYTSITKLLRNIDFSIAEM